MSEVKKKWWSGSEGIEEKRTKGIAKGKATQKIEKTGDFWIVWIKKTWRE